MSLTSFATDSASASVSGLINSRIETSFSANYSNGRRAAGDQRPIRELQRLDAVAVRDFAVLREHSDYDYYVYRFGRRRSADGLSPEFDRHAIRVGYHASAAPLWHLC